jgi:hypothetical protein
LQYSVFWHWLASAAVHPTHFLDPGSQTRNLGEHAAHEAFVVQMTVGTAF